MSTQAEGKSKYSVNFHIWGTLGNYDFLYFYQLAVDEDWLRNQVLAAGDDDDNAWGGRAMQRQRTEPRRYSPGHTAVVPSNYARKNFLRNFPAVAVVSHAISILGYWSHGS